MTHSYDGQTAKRNNQGFVDFSVHNLHSTYMTFQHAAQRAYLHLLFDYFFFLKLRSPKINICIKENVQNIFLM